MVFSTDVKVLAHDASTNIVGCHTKVGLVKIGNNVFVDSRTLILCNTRIENNVIIGVGSVVTKDIPDNSVVAGNPTKILCTVAEFRKKQKKILRLIHISHNISGMNG